MQSAAFLDYYEVLQLSPNADTDTVHRVYRMLAQRFHPDNTESGNTETFRQVTQAYDTLSQPEKRAAYDVEHRSSRKLNWRIFDQSNSSQGVEAEKRKRQGVLQVLYRKRMSEPAHAGMNVQELEELLAVPREHLEFTLWYLRESSCVIRTDNGRFCITLKGCEVAEVSLAKPEAPPAPASNAAIRLVRAANDRLGQG